MQAELLFKLSYLLLSDLAGLIAGFNTGLNHWA